MQYASVGLQMCSEERGTIASRTSAAGRTGGQLLVDVEMREDWGWMRVRAEDCAAAVATVSLAPQRHVRRCWCIVQALHSSQCRLTW